jgi:hypothetical protein
MNNTASTANDKTQYSRAAPPVWYAGKGNLAPKRHHNPHTAFLSYCHKVGAREKIGLAFVAFEPFRRSLLPSMIPSRSTTMPSEVFKFL